MLVYKYTCRTLNRNFPLALRLYFRDVADEKQKENFHFNKLSGKKNLNKSSNYKRVKHFFLSFPWHLLNFEEKKA